MNDLEEIANLLILQGNTPKLAYGMAMAALEYKQKETNDAR